MLRNAARAQSGWWVNSSSHGWKSVRMTLRNSRNRRKSKRKSLPDGGAANRIPGNLHVISAHLCRCRQRSQHHCRTPANKLPKTPQLKDPKPFTAPQRPISGRFCEKHTGKPHLLGSPDAFSKWLRHPPIVRNSFKSPNSAEKFRKWACNCNKRRRWSPILALI